MTSTVLISGASIAGPAAAYWLNRAGHRVTVVEKAGALRAGGYPIDIRGTAVEVVRRMGILPRLREAHIDSRRATFLNADGSVAASIAGGGGGPDLEVRRGDLAESLYATVRDDVEFLFDDSIGTLTDSGHGVDVTFKSGIERTYDVVVGADGAHSATRRLVFGPEEQFHHHLGYAFAIFTMPNVFGLSRELLMWNSPGRAAALYAVGDDEDLHVFLNIHRPAFEAAAFDGAGWEVPRLVEAMREADDLFVDTAGQIRMPHWSRGRVALVGDAAYAPSFLTGQGSSLALVGAYMLARSVNFAAYEQGLRGFVEANQALAGNGLFPTTAEALERRNAMLRGLGSMPAGAARPAHSALTLPPMTPDRSGTR